MKSKVILVLTLRVRLLSQVTSVLTLNRQGKSGHLGRDPRVKDVFLCLFYLKRLFEDKKLLEGVKCLVDIKKNVSQTRKYI